MTETEVRAAIMAVIAQLQVDWTEYPLVIEPESRKVVDQGSQDKPYLKVFIDFLKADQIDMSNAPRTQQWGQIHLQAVDKCGEGVMRAAALRDHLRSYFHLKNLDGVQCYEAELHKSAEIAGWEHYPVLINFYYID